ncbi:hypothetical protein D1007_47690 [Hordeum vulgare]|nr:hypothetical protein D1007_47690 [Hordeum vulgare]
MEEALGKLYILEEEATPLIIDDTDEGTAPKWLLAGKVLYRNLLHIQTITNALRPAWGNPKGLTFRSLGENMFAAEFATKRDRDRVWNGSPWHISKHVMILEDFEPHIQPSELKFDRLQVWARVINLPYNLKTSSRGLTIAKQIDANATMVEVDPVGGYLRARVMIAVEKPLRRWILITSAKRKQTDCYDIQYENIPHFCFSCGRLGHSDLFCLTPETRDENGALPFKPSLRAPEDRKRTTSGEHTAKEKQDQPNSTRESRSASTKNSKGTEVTSPAKLAHLNKRKGVPQNSQVYRQDLMLLSEHDERFLHLIMLES